LVVQIVQRIPKSPKLPRLFTITNWYIIPTLTISSITSCFNLLVDFLYTEWTKITTANGVQCLRLHFGWQDIVSYNTIPTTCVTIRNIFGYNRKTGELISAFNYIPGTTQYNVMMHLNKNVLYLNIFGTRFYKAVDVIATYNNNPTLPKYFKRTSCELFLFVFSFVFFP